MGKIIQPAGPNGVVWAGTTDRQEFSVRLKHGGVDLAIHGDMEIIIQMLYQAAETYDHAAKTLITTVLIFADQKGIPLEDLKKHSYLEGSQIVKKP